MDFRDPRATVLLPEHDALVHLAYVVLRGRMREPAMRAINVTGSLELLQTAHSSGIRRIVHLSSAAVYGVGTNLAEAAPYAPLADFCYGQHKAELEKLLEATLPQCVRLRPHVILGNHAQPTLHQMLGLPFFLKLADPQPELQCVHENDVADAILACLLRDVHGAFNLAAPDTFDLRSIMRKRQAFSLPLSPAVARTGLKMAHRLTGWGGEPEWLTGLQHTLTLNCRHATQELGWRPAYGSAQTLASTG